jgi:hypothetical protein
VPVIRYLGNQPPLPDSCSVQGGDFTAVLIYTTNITAICFKRRELDSKSGRELALVSLYPH